MAEEVKITISIRISKKTYRKVKIESAKRMIGTSQFVEEAVEEKLAKPKTE